jgi:tRNA (guanine-N7-)-methyltransferase
MSFGLGRGRDLDDAPGVIGVSPQELPPLPDAALTDPEAGRVDPRRWFSDPSLPFELEIGSGKGTFILQTAKADPGTNYLGIEWAGEFYLYAADRVRRAGLTNVRMLRTDATEFLRWRCPSAIARVIHLYFSDPWPKSRHHKNRVVQDRFLADARRVLIPGGELRIVTDHAEYWAWIEEHAARWTAPAPSDASATPETRAAANALGVSAYGFDRLPFDAARAAGSGELVGTNFERKYRQEGRAFYGMVLRKTGAGGPDAHARPV